ncbi:MAG: histidine--tRNA ligase family protein [Dehalococcoidia bacterium]|nr:histidine--tRNA ligase family protein [Dehalococcoidia bacterium]
MASSTVKRLVGMRDLREEEYLRLHDVQKTLQALFTSYGYRIIEPPMLEATETFARKAGGELTARLYSFQEPGGHNVSLRPEFTSAITRVYREQGDDQPLPVRWQYGGPVFRYYAEQPERPRQFWQVGVELIGAGGAQADAEVLTLAIRGAQALGLNDAHLVLGDIGILRALLIHMGLSERAQQFLLRNLGALKGNHDGVAQLRTRAQEVGLLRERPDQTEAQRALAVLSAAEKPQAGGSRNGKGSLASRAPDEIATRLRAKLSGPSQAATFDHALEVLARLAQLAGEPREVLPQVRHIIRVQGMDDAPFARFTQTLDTLRGHQVKPAEAQGLRMDFTLARDIAYYSGVVFELRAGDDGPGAGRRTLAAGGRYDGLLKALGVKSDVPAIGFAFSLDTAAEAMRTAKATTNQRRAARRVLVVPATPAANIASLRAAETLRLGGEAVEQALLQRSIAEHRRYAGVRGMNAVVVVSEDGQSERFTVERTDGDAEVRPAQ